MSDIINTENPEMISKMEIVKENKDSLDVKVVTNLALQREIYESLYKEKSKDVKIEGFRAGKAPREMIEPKIYNELASALVDQVAYLVASELPEKLDKKYTLLASPVIKKVDFKVVESPIEFEVKVYVAKDLKIPDVSKYKVEVNEKDLEVTDEEVEKALVQSFEEYKKQAKKDDVKMDDEWVKTLKIPEVDTIAKLKDYIKKSLEKEKFIRGKIAKLEQVLDKIVSDLGIEIPDELVDKYVEQEIEKRKKDVQQYGITLEKYLEYYKKSIDDFKKEIAEQVRKDLQNEVFRQVYAKQNNIKLEKDDHVYMELAMAQLRVPAEALQDMRVLQMIARLALTFKVYDDIAEKVGIGKVYFDLIPPHQHNHDHDHGNHADNKDADTSGKKSQTQEPKKGTTSKILIADE